MRYLLTIDVPDRSLLTLAEGKLREIGASVERMEPSGNTLVIDTTNAQMVAIPNANAAAPSMPSSTDCSNCEPIPDAGMVCVGRVGAS